MACQLTRHPHPRRHDLAPLPVCSAPYFLDRLPDIQGSGATSVVLSPVTLQGRSGLPLALFAPEPRYAMGPPSAAGHELRQLIAGLHNAGLEVLLQVRPRSGGVLQRGEREPAGQAIAPAAVSAFTVTACMRPCASIAASHPPLPLAA